MPGWFFLKPSHKSSPNDKMLPYLNEGNSPTQMSSQILKPLFCDFLGSCAI
jgi:hypothetical protein